MIDLDRFKEINDTLGHHNGDLLLCMIGARLTDTARRRLRRPARRRRVRRAVADRRPGRGRRGRARVRAAISERLELEGIGVEVEASVGIALYPEHGEDPETLLQRADVAMYAAKRARSGSAVYGDEVTATRARTSS